MKDLLIHCALFICLLSGDIILTTVSVARQCDLISAKDQLTLDDTGEG